MAALTSTYWDRIEFDRRIRHRNEKAEPESGNINAVELIGRDPANAKELAAPLGGATVGAEGSSGAQEVAKAAPADAVIG
ncbi:hypothetical protein ACIRJM_35160 [Streptomyces sp. NPDC102405]|uniref:hypothetical protein n=1 Tax=Streptomyces sp. NPDC102405 TaxID=3366170 RepID=UPI00382F0FEB